jgi:uncharacterized membrane protein YfcA
MIAGLSATDWTLLIVAAVMVGFAKTAVNGVGALAVVLFAVVLPARLSTGALLPLLIAGDLVAVALYRRHGHARTLLGLLPGVVPGLLLGALFVAQVGDTVMQLAIGSILLGLGAFQLLLRRRGSVAAVRDSLAVHRGWTVVAGLVAGFATMAANAGGSVMTLYLIMAGLPVLEMLGTGAWFFLAVNLLKAPLSTSLDLINLSTLVMAVALAPAMVTGALVGHRTVRRMDQQQFELAALALGMVSAGILIATA